MLFESIIILITTLLGTVKLKPIGEVVNIGIYNIRILTLVPLVWKAILLYHSLPIKGGIFFALESHIFKYDSDQSVPCCGSSTNPTPWSVSHMDLHGLPGSSSLVSISSSLLGEFDPLLPDDGSLSTMCARNDGIGGGGMSSMEGGGPRSTHSRPVPSIQVAAVARHRPDPIKFSVLIAITNFGL